MKAFVTGLRLSIPLAVIVALLGAYSVSAQTPEASPEASPVAGSILPEGPLGEQLQWIVDTANAGAGKITIEQINEHFDPVFFEETPMCDVFKILAALQSAGITYEIDPIGAITTMDLPASNGRITLNGSDGSQISVSVQIDRDSGLIVGLTIEPVTDATPVASPAA